MKPSIFKKAAGLQRFAMDCGFWRSAKWTGARRLDLIGLQTVAVSFCNEHLTDGALPGPSEELALSLGVRAKEVAKAVPVMLKMGLWESDGEGYRIPGYTGHNPSRDELMDHRERKTLAAVKANHTRWHKDGKTDPDCILCDSDSDPPSESADVSDSDAIRNGAPLPLEQCSVEQSSSASSSIEDDDDDDFPRGACWEVCRRAAELRLAVVAEPVANPEKWLLSVAMGIRDHHNAAIVDRLFKGDSTEAIAAEFGPKLPSNNDPNPTYRDPFGTRTEPEFEELDDGTVRIAR